VGSNPTLSAISFLVRSPVDLKGDATMSVRRWIKLLAVLMGVCSGIVLAYGTLLAFPEPLFDHRYDYRGFTVYSHVPLDARIEPILDTTAARLAASPWYSSSTRHRVFVAGTPGWYTFFNGPYRVAMGRRYELGGSIFLPTLDLAAGEVVHFDGRRARATWVLAHEAAHGLIQNRLGLLRTARLPRWKREGYPEFVATGGDGTLAEGVRELDEPPGSALVVGGYWVPRAYLQAHMMVRYQLEVARTDLEGLFADSLRGETVERHLRRWAARG
jgi:hypothetical protein